MFTRSLNKSRKEFFWFYFCSWCNLVFIQARACSLRTSDFVLKAVPHHTQESLSNTKSVKDIIIREFEKKNNNPKTNKWQKQDKTTWIKTSTHLSCLRWSVANSSSRTTPGGNEVKGQHWEGRALIRSKAEQLKTDTTPNPHMDFLPFLKIFSRSADLKHK